jgi:hypothetical protein
MGFRVLSRRAQRDSKELKDEIDPDGKRKAWRVASARLGVGV